MKKLFVLISFLAMSSTTFAYSGYYDDEVGVFLILLYILIGVLSLILFFKLWGQTNNVKKLKEKYCDSNIDDEIQYNLFAGKFEEARELAMKKFFLTVKNAEKNDIEFTNSRFEILVSELKNVYAFTGSKAPTIVNNMSKKNDFEHLFSDKMPIKDGCLVVVKATGTLTRVSPTNPTVNDTIYKGEDGVEYQKDDITPYFCPQLLLETYLK